MRREAAGALAAFDARLAAGVLRARKDVLAGPFGDEIQDWRPVEGRKGPGKCRDDALDAVAGCLEAEPTPICKTAPLSRPRHDWRGTGRTYRVVMERGGCVRYGRAALSDGGKRMTAYFIVRAEVDPEAREAFDAWYETEHLPGAVEALGAAGAARGWSGVEDNVHVAFYEFADLAAVQRMMASDALKGMIAEFSRHWDGKVARTRDAVEIVQKI